MDKDIKMRPVPHSKPKRFLCIRKELRKGPAWNREAYFDEVVSVVVLLGGEVI